MDFQQKIKSNFEIFGEVWITIFFSWLRSHRKRCLSRKRFCLIFRRTRVRVSDRTSAMPKLFIVSPTSQRRCWESTFNYDTTLSFRVFFLWFVIYYHHILKSIFGDGVIQVTTTVSSQLRHKFSCGYFVHGVVRGKVSVWVFCQRHSMNATQSFIHPSPTLHNQTADTVTTQNGSVFTLAKTCFTVKCNIQV